MDPSSSTSTTMAVSDHPVDPVESLRAAALSTLKAKRRRPARPTLPEKAPAHVPSRPPPPSDTFQLDYGFEEENAAGISMTVDLASEKLAEQDFIDDERQSREEGEISEEEEPPPLPLSKLPSPPTRKASKTPIPVVKDIAEPQKSDEVQQSIPIRDSTPPRKSTTPQLQPKPMEGISEAINYPTIAEEEEELSDDPMADDFESIPNPPVSLVDFDHVRPGLSLTQQEYDTIKDVILDLLGWAVPVETILESGVSKQLIYYVFSELNLRLPDTFDTSDMIPYTPEIFNQLLASDASTMPPNTERQPASFDFQESAVAESSMRSMTPPPPWSPPATIAAATMPQSPNDNDNDLHDMERQRRQELIARKAAVAASRKSKAGSIENSVVTSHFDRSYIDQEDVVMDSVAPSKTVDDFLNSLGPVQELEVSTSVKSEETLPQPTMEVDGDVEYEQVLEWNPLSGRASQDTIPADPVHIEPPPSAEPPPSSAEPPHTSVNSATSTFSQMSYLDLISPSIAELIAPENVERLAPLRRTTKRPVASDFVDFDSEPRKQDSTGHNEQLNGFARPTSIPRRLNSSASFSNVGGARRCVIDLSDSEEENDHHREQTHVKLVTEQRRDSGRPSKMGKYPAPVPPKPQSSTVSPAILEQKELEIRKMRQLIAQREEETRLKKLAMAKPTIIPNPKLQTISQPQPVSLKKEKLDITMTSSVAEPEQEVNDEPPSPDSPNSVSSTPPPSSEDSRFSPPKFSNGVNHSLTGRKTNNGDGSDEINHKISPSQDVVTEAQESQVPSDQDQQNTPTLPLGASEGSVDADSNTSPSTQMNQRSTFPTSVSSRQILQEQDARSPHFSNSTLNNDQQDQSALSTYLSPFESYPRLLDHPRRMLSDRVLFSHDLSPSSSSPMYSTSRPSLSSDLHPVQAKSSSSSSFVPFTSLNLPVPDLKPLKLMTSVKLFDPFRRLCQYEIPGGGTCRDSGCEDVHLSRLQGATEMDMVKPTDHDTAQYLFDTLPSSWLVESGITSPDSIYWALQHTDHRTANNPLSFEDRVAQALLSFGPPPTT